MNFKLNLLLAAFCLAGSLQAQQVTTIASQVGIDDDIIIAPDGSLIGSNYEGTALRRLTLDGEVSVFASGFSAPNGLAYDSEGTLYMADNTGNAIYKITEEGHSETFVSIVSPSGLIREWDSDTLIATTYAGDRLVKISPEGEITDFVNDPALNGPVGLCYDEDHQLYVANFNDRKIFKVYEDGTLSLFSDISTSGYLGFIAYRNGYLYATLFQQAEIWRVDNEGQDELWLGSVTGSMDGGPDEATFNRPNGIRFSHSTDTLFITDFGSKAVRMVTDIDGVNSSNPVFPLALESHLSFSPNPVSDLISVSVEVPQATRGALYISNSQGQIVRQLCREQTFSKGQHQQAYTLGDLPPGQYYLSFQFEENRQVRLTQPFIIQ
jgi:sugar lactone lactonase YvrE